MPDASYIAITEADNKSIYDATDREVESWHEAARNGQTEAKDKLCCWVYVTAHKYFHAKARVEEHLTTHDAEEMTSEFFVEFEQTFPQIRTATHFTRRMLKNKLGRYIERERMHRRREATQARFDEVDFLTVSEDYQQRPWEGWSDIEWHQYRTTLQVLRDADDVTRTIIAYRLRGLSYRQISPLVNLSEAALRMRVMRFYGAVRERYEGVELRI